MKFLAYPNIIKSLTILASISILLVINLAYYFFDIRSKNFAPLVPKADCIVVLGAAVWPQGQPSPVLSDRLLRAVSLYKMQIAPKIICTGGIGKYPPSEAQVSKNFLINHGVPEKDILYENITTSTAQQSSQVKLICQQQGFNSVALVTSFFHQRRAIRIFQLAGVPNIFDARCVHTPYQDLNFWCIREALFLAKLNWPQWTILGLFLAIFIIRKLSF